MMCHFPRFVYYLFISFPLHVNKIEYKGKTPLAWHLFCNICDRPGMEVKNVFRSLNELLMEIL